MRVSNPRKLAHVITGLETGGAETMLLALLASTRRAQWSPSVVSLRDRGTLATEIERLHVPVTTLGLGRGWPNPMAVWRLWRGLRRESPELLVGWMYHGNVAALLARPSLGRRIPVVWDIQYTPDADLSVEKKTTAWMIRLGAQLSGRVTRIIYNAKVSAERHAQLGYATRHATVIPNGVDTRAFAPSPGARQAWRARLGLSSETLLIGRIGRYHTMKDFPGFLEAIAQLAGSRADIHVVLAGRGVDTHNTDLVSLVRRLRLERSVSLLGEVRPATALTASLDIACSPSAYGEAFPGVLVEAMASGVPCVTTDVGDSAWIVGATGHVVPARDPVALAAALRALVDAGAEVRHQLGVQARARVCENFSIDRVAAQYETVFAEVTS